VSKRKPPQYDLPHAAPDPLRLVQQFLNTSDHEYGNEWIGTPADFAAWLDTHDASVARVTRTDVARAQRVREALRALVIGVDDDVGARALLDEEARHATLRVSFEGGLLPARDGIDGFLGRVFAVVHDAMRDGSWQRLKACPNCHWAFWDASKNRSATWCSMELCGNRLKTKRYRSKRAATAN
jgi:predicted RNA-binding Zn ribbon-like protein